MVIQKKKIEFFETKLVDFFQKSGRVELPWRKKGINAYEVWVSEIMLQQTQVSRVISYYERFLKKFPTVQKLAKASWEEFLPYYQGLGYYARGRNMLATAKKVVTEYQGVFPANATELRLLPGVGEYTAGAILSFAYGQETLAWDTNLKRVIGRFFYGDKKAEVDMRFFETHLKTKRKILNAALMDFGSSICTGRPKCNTCPLASKCLYLQEEGKQEIRTKKQEEIFALSEAEYATVILHEKHQKYFSSLTKTYRPFNLPRGYTTRGAIKDWFLQKYGLVVAVRPSHARKIVGQEKTLLVNAQILTGEQSFSVFSKQAVKEYNKDSL